VFATTDEEDEPLGVRLVMLLLTPAQGFVAAEEAAGEGESGVEGGVPGHGGFCGRGFSGGGGGGGCWRVSGWVLGKRKGRLEDGMGWDGRAGFIFAPFKEDATDVTPRARVPYHEYGIVRGHHLACSRGDPTS